ncbi:MAG: hypothetical protein JWQ18_1179, partial [Conexibacter sp.]|nr:hypothetical protein [Conexibacter sp.]
MGRPSERCDGVASYLSSTDPPASS